MALLAEPPYAQRLLNRSEVQEMLQSLKHRSHRYVGQQLLHPEAQRISLREDLPHKHATGASFGGTRLIINPVESQREPSKPILLGHLAAETGSAFELMYVKYLLEEGRVTMAREILQRILQQYPADEKLLHFYNAIAPGKVVRTNMHYSDRSLEMDWIRVNSSVYRGKWVALLGANIVAIGDDLKSVLRMVQEQQPHATPLIHHMD